MFAAISLVATSAAFGWGQDISTSKGESTFLNLTHAQDLMGRLRYNLEGEEPTTGDQKNGASLDIVSCGKGYCGIAVDADGSCGAVILRFEDQGPRFAATKFDEYFERFAGSLDWPDKTGTYRVFLDVSQNPGRERPLHNDETTLEIDGSSDGTYARAFPFQVLARYSGAATCSGPLS